MRTSLDCPGGVEKLPPRNGCRREMAVLLGRCCSVSFAHLVLEAQQQNPNSPVKLWQAVEDRVRSQLHPRASAVTLLGCGAEDGCQDDDTCGSKVVPEADAVRTTPRFWYPLWESSRRKMRRLYCFAGPALATRSPWMVPAPEACSQSWKACPAIGEAVVRLGA